MPELPEVEMYRLYLEASALDQEVADVEVHHPKVTGGEEENLKTLIGDRFVGTRRWGKNLFIETAKSNLLFMHFGMTGNLEYYNASMEAPKYSRVVFHFKNGFDLAYVSKRMFGRLGLVDNIEGYIQDKSIGADALEISEEEFMSKISRKKKNIKGALLDQNVSAGIGNWIADEILYQAKIQPTSHMSHLNKQHLSTIYEKMREIMQVAISVEAVREELPPHYITHYGRKSTVVCPRCKLDIEKTEVGGRGTYACESCQELITT